MRPWGAWCWGGLASAVALLINVVFFCTSKKKTFKPALSPRSKRYQVNSSNDGEQEALLSDVGAQSARSDLDTSQAAAHEPNGASAAAEDKHSIGTVPVKPAPQQLAVTPSSKELLVTTAAVPDSPGAAVGTEFLQGLIEKELGPPKFAVAKEPITKPASHIPSPSLEALLDQEFGPPKFAVPKANTWGQAPIATSKDHGTGVAASTDSATPAPAAPHHLRLEVVAGPSIGNVFDTVDQAMEVRIGRLPDCSLALTEDHEVSSKHATIHYSLADNCWKLIDVGSLNGSSLNGLALSANRQPSSPTPLASGDVVLLGSVTRVVVTCTPSQARAPVAAVAMPAPGQLPPIHTVAMVGPAAGATRGSDPGALAHGRETLESGSGTGSRAATVGMTAHMLSVVGPPLAVRHNEQLGISMAVQQRLGTDHKRTNTGCEDVALWELPWCERSTSALLAIFDGHQGVRAASRAKEVLPQLLREKLKAFEAAGESSHVVHGRSASAQASLLKALFLETDAAIALDEGCTATVFLMERDAQGACLIQSANVGDSSAVLVQLPASSASPAVPAVQPPLPSPGSSSPSHAAAATTTATTAPPPLTHAPTRRRARASLDNLLPTVHSPQPSPGDNNHHNHHQQGTGASHLAALPETDGASAEASGNGATATAQAVQGSAGGYTPPAGTEGGALEGGGHWVKLSEDHRISSSAKERERLAGLGHKTVRTRLYGLNISRMLGDKFLKDEALGFIAEPHVSPCLRVIPGTGHAEVWQQPQQPAEQQQPSGAEGEGRAAPASSRGAEPPSGERGPQGGLGEADGRTYVILASDGLWDVLGEARAGSLIARTMAQDPGTSVTELAGLLLSQAVALRSKDDITVMVAELHAQGPTDR